MQHYFWITVDPQVIITIRIIDISCENASLFIYDMFHTRLYRLYTPVQAIDTSLKLKLVNSTMIQSL